ncbi:MAG TPA: sulfotransferase [Humisphaera sp.]|nr:sulfotransferase [Humisphaera sp.]
MSVEASVQPVILLGMHRSGTAMIARLLDELGLFQGAEIQGDHEALWFLDINEALLRRVNASWDSPARFDEFLANPAAFDLTSRCLHEDVSSKGARRFLGRLRAMRHGSLLKYNLPWGWKDPRTLLTLPLWLDVFPGAKLVYIARNGVDVARSLMAREQRELERRAKDFASHGTAGNQLKIHGCGYKGSCRCLTFRGSFSLWEEYVERAEAALEKFNNPHMFLRFETFLANPPAELARLATFCGVDSSEQAISKAIASVKVNPERGNAAAADPVGTALLESVRGNRWMSHYGYGDFAPPTIARTVNSLKFSGVAS